jgi:hypothetical protein
MQSCWKRENFIEVEMWGKKMNFLNYDKHLRKPLSDFASEYQGYEFRLDAR